MSKKSESGHSNPGSTSPNSPTLRQLKDQPFPPTLRKSSVDSNADRENFCFSLSNEDYEVLRTYINANNSQQTKLYYSKFTPNKKKEGQICIIHGYGENSDNYLPVNFYVIEMAEYFVKKGYVINMIDMRGFGYSGGDRVNEPTRKVLSDIETLMRNCCERDLATFIIAQGLGALFINALLQENRDLPIAGVINITPLVSFINQNRSSTFQKILINVLPITKNILVHSMINPTALVKDPYAIKAIIEGSFSEFFITMQMADEYEQIGEKVTAEGYKFLYPTLFCCGGQDKIQNLQDIKEYYSSLASIDKQMITFKQGLHQLHNDYEADELFLRVFEWIELKKGKIKWKQPKAFEKNTIIRKKHFLKKALMIVAFLLGLVGVLRKLVGCFRKLNRF